MTATDFTPERAADPTTPLPVLAQIATERPDLRPFIASNPATYPELLTWMAAFGDPAVHEAIARRTNVGTDVPPPPPPPPAPAPPAAGPSAAYPSTAGPTAPAVDPGTARTLPVPDMVRDAVAAFLLLASLALPWQSWSTVSFWDAVFVVDARAAGTHVEVLLVTLVSLLTLALPYLGYAGVLPTDWSPARVRTIRALGNAPYVLLVLGYLVWAGLGRTPLLASAAYLGLAGAALAAQPRTSELDAAGVASTTSVWRAVFIGLVAAAPTLSFLAVVASLAQTVGHGVPVLSVLTLALGLLPVAAIAALPGLGAIRHDWAWATVLVWVGGGVATWALLSSGASGFVATSASDLGFLLVPALATVAMSPVLYPSGPARDAQSWFTAAQHGLEFILPLAGYLAIAAVLRMIDIGVRAPDATTLVVSVLAAVAAIIARSLVVRSAFTSRAPVIAISTAIAVLGLIAAAVQNQHSALSVEVVVAFIVLPSAVAITMIAPSAVRRLVAENTAATH